MQSDENDNDGPLDPDEAFALLGNETRFTILQTLWNAPGYELSFSELRTAAGLRESGGVNYHLRKLLGRFVVQTNDGYRLRFTGAQVIGAVLSGTYTREITRGPVEIEATCDRCDAPLQASHREGRGVVACSGCSEWRLQVPMPPGALEGYDATALPTVIDRWQKQVARQMTAGFCLLCSGRLLTSLRAVSSHAFDFLIVTYTCQLCGSTADLPIDLHLLEYPLVVSFYHDHGIDVRATPVWELQYPFADATLLATDPPRARVTFSVDGDELSLRVNSDVNVLTEDE